ncbi:MAG: hypothetical protein LBG60_02230 [Bifidobacteriaceae bacterium]|nr:hypothetical protein [Bifidobacteriaceae bacterium]
MTALSPSVVAAAAVITAEVLLGAVGCVAGDTAKLRAADVPGLTLDQVAPHVPTDEWLYTQDVSPLVGEEPSYSGADAASSAWTVVAICSTAEFVEDSEPLELAVVPTSTVDDEVRQRIADDGFLDTVNCGGAEPRPGGARVATERGQERGE